MGGGLLKGLGLAGGVAAAIKLDDANVTALGRNRTAADNLQLYAGAVPLVGGFTGGLAARAIDYGERWRYGTEGRQAMGDYVDTSGERMERAAAERQRNDFLRGQRLTADEFRERDRDILRSAPVTAEFAKKEATKLADESDLFKELLKLSGGKTVQQIAEEKVKLEQEIKLKVELEEQKLNDTLAQGVKNLDGRMEGNINRILQVRLNDISLNALARKATSK